MAHKARRKFHRLLIDLGESIELPDDLIHFRRRVPPATENTVPPHLIIDARGVMLRSLCVSRCPLVQVTLQSSIQFTGCTPRLTLRGLLVLDILNTLPCRTQARTRSVVIGVGIHLQTRLDERRTALKTDRRRYPPQQRRVISGAGGYLMVSEKNRWYWGKGDGQESGNKS